jgi:hypothetical protein
VGGGEEREKAGNFVKTGYLASNRIVNPRPLIIALIIALIL